MPPKHTVISILINPESFRSWFNVKEIFLKTQLQISIKSLVEYSCRSGDLNVVFGGNTRSQEDNRGLRMIQNSRPSGCVKDISVTHFLETENVALKITGTIGAIYQDEDSVLLEEIKLSRSDPNRLEETGNSASWGQLKCCAYIYGIDHGLDKINGRIVYYHFDTEQISEVKHSFTMTELADYFQFLVTRYLEWADALVRWGIERNKSIRELNFPFPDYRPGQRKMAVATYKTIRDKSQLLVQASTGIGKTIATLFPAIKAMKEGHTDKLFYLTAKTTGRNLAEKALDDMRNKGLRIKAITLTAKKKICFMPEASCTPEECRYAKGYYNRIEAALKDAFLQDSFPRETVEELAQKHQVCPFEFSLDLSLWADCIICDYNYVFDPRASLKRFFLDPKNEFTLLIDESHNLVDRSREMFSAEIKKQPFLDIRRDIKTALPQIHKTMGTINSWLVKTRRRCSEAGGYISEKEQPEEIYSSCKKFLKQTEQWLAKNIQSAFRSDLLDLYFSVSRFMRVAGQYDECYSTCFEKQGKEFNLKLFCIDPSKHLAKTLERCRASIFFSATMIPFDYFSNLLGIRKSAGLLDLPSPFPKDNFRLLLCNRISTFYKDREATKLATGEVIASLVRQKRGNYLLFFPSYEYMMMVHDSFQAEYPDVETICQTPGMSETDRQVFLDRFTERSNSILAGFAVMGGVFGEGIDLVGESLSGAIIVGVGLPGISPERDIIRDYFHSSHKTGFDYAYLYPGINRVFQALGRVIRTENDRGVVLLIDSRFSTTRYQRLFPAYWRPRVMNNPRQIERVLQKFWGGTPVP